MMFQMSTTEGWANNLWNGIDSVGINMSASINYNFWATIYFIIFMMFGALFIMNLFIGIVISSF